MRCGEAKYRFVRHPSFACAASEFDANELAVGVHVVGGLISANRFEEHRRSMASRGKSEQ